MDKNFKIVKLDTNYCNYLRNFDSKVPFNYGKKETRPFIGVLFNVNNLSYFASLSSPKEKHLVMKNALDFLKLNKGILGAINFNNMIPVSKENYTLIDLDKKYREIEKAKYQKLLVEQLNWLNDNSISVRTKAIKLYTLYNENRLPYNIKNRCCNFKLLEEKCADYNKDKVSV